MTVKTILGYTLGAALATTTVISSAHARDQVQIAGSSTVLPYAAIVAEAFGENTEFPSPVVESGGSGAGRKKLCEGVGENTIDIANSSSRIKQSDIDTCAANGVKDIQEVRIGYDGIVFASDIKGSSYEFTPADWFNALAKQVVVDGKLVDNANAKWSDVRDGMPGDEILAFIPGTKHGTREVFDKKVLEAGCKATGALDIFSEANGGDKKKAKKACHALRTDGRSIDIDGDYTETLSRVDANKNGIGVFGLSFYQNNTDKLQVATMGGITPSVETIASGEYAVSRPLYFYVKNAHLDVIPGMQAYIEFFVSDEMAGPDGPLAAYGLVSDPELKKTQEAVKNRTPMGALTN